MFYSTHSARALNTVKNRNCRVSRSCDMTVSEILDITMRFAMKNCPIQWRDICKGIVFDLKRKPQLISQNETFVYATIQAVSLKMNIKIKFAMKKWIIYIYVMLKRLSFKPAPPMSKTAFLLKKKTKQKRYRFEISIIWVTYFAARSEIYFVKFSLNSDSGGTESKRDLFK